tara:strand:+ start:351 stop:626 length:276 start_codon:yes stop_codon:yes gene_type:complete
MSKKELKITEEQLEVLKAQQASKANIVTDIGVVEAQKHELLHALANVMDKQKELAKELEEQYGKINVNLEDGSYEVIEVEEKEEEVVEEEK